MQCKAEMIDLVSSETLELESEQNPLDIRREYSESALESAKFYVVVSDEIESRAHEFVDLGIKPLDALHLASAEEAGADYFCTCDDRLLRRAKTVSNLNIVVVTPLELVEELNIMIAETKPLAEITHEAIRILFREMGVVNTVRFINQYTAGYGNYTEERRELFAEQTLEDLVSKIKQRRERSIKSEPNAE